ncbi:hypothetical protein PCASD_00239 [Puccinia coronata f. sp. avenae]|uniref:Uncharacterized protein n=1 Tax=Puccinia coronata f. sp. avenae TaxID=200324 RepID=A0A2N5VR03_9BASI|nr:hypothetical protein PCASD_00239 [Puccinia coronata f. sp. avenae]
MNKFCQLQRFKAQGGLDCAIEERKKGTAGINFEIDASAYREILDFCWKSAPDLRAYDDVPHRKNSQILFNHTKSIRSAECSNRMRISRQKPNDMIEYMPYMVNGKTSYGQAPEIRESNPCQNLPARTSSSRVQTGPCSGLKSVTGFWEGHSLRDELSNYLSPEASDSDSVAFSET